MDYGHQTECTAAGAEIPSMNMQSLVHEVRLSRSSIWRILWEHDMCLFHMQHVQELQPDDYTPYIAFIQQYLGKCAADPLFLGKVLFSDEASFIREGIFETHNAHMWAEENSHAIWRCAVQTWCSVNVWTCIMGEHLIGPYLLPFRLAGCNYLLILQQVLPQLLGDK